jgi:trk system potassium uptake protein TrkA
VHVVIMGCGRVGSELALRLQDAGHTVSIVDQDPEAFERMDPAFTGETIVGVGFDRDALRAAGIEKAQAFAAVSSGDNSNIVAARVARETFGVPNVVARIYDPRRAEVYQRLGIPTVASVQWTTNQMMRRLLPMGTAEEWRDATGTAVLAEIDINPGWYGHRLQELAEASGARIALITRLGSGLIPDRDTVLQEGDIIHAIFAAADRTTVEGAFAEVPKESE